MTTEKSIVVHPGNNVKKTRQTDFKFQSLQLK